MSMFVYTHRGHENREHGNEYPSRFKLLDALSTRD